MVDLKSIIYIIYIKIITFLGYTKDILSKYGGPYITGFIYYYRNTLGQFQETKKIPYTWNS